ncbi:hypothetical protein GDO86_007268 [Hymenochirus boettgeri]|uniref:Dual specificity protein phosphatase n=1 Tax=Hymenochirus boettgeri TaxID=247094 RepID=A0A8T2J143_9PIPI|nr:hypothetical protein GDO86_007268 [Hymenochirus boettgeri]
MAVPSKSAEWRGGAGVRAGESLLLLDCRPHDRYQRLTSSAAISLTVPGLMLRRLRKGNLSVRSVIPNDRDKERENGSPGTVAGTAAPKLREDGCRAHYLKGGYAKFQREYPEYCGTALDNACPNKPVPEAVLGLGSLRISSECSDGESDRELSSATESEGSPTLTNQSTFPVQILPYLFLGCAKDSANHDILAKYNIKYILNVTPNLPNTFEHDGEFKYKQIPISDHWSQNLSQFFPEAISFIEEARSKKCGILVHCLAGISRSVTVTVAYLMQKLNLSLNDAYDFVKRKKSNISPNFNFMGQLLDFERTLGLKSPCDIRSPTTQLYFSTPTNRNLFQLDSLEFT